MYSTSSLTPAHPVSLPCPDRLEDPGRFDDPVLLDDQFRLDDQGRLDDPDWPDDPHWPEYSVSPDDSVSLSPPDTLNTGNLCDAYRAALEILGPGLRVGVKVSHNWSGRQTRQGGRRLYGALGGGPCQGADVRL